MGWIERNMEHLHLLELGRFSSASCNIVAVTWIAVYQTEGLEVEDFDKLEIYRLEHLWWVIWCDVL